MNGDHRIDRLPLGLSVSSLLPFCGQKPSICHSLLQWSLCGSVLSPGKREIGLVDSYTSLSSLCPLFIIEQKQNSFQSHFPETWKWVWRNLYGNVFFFLQNFLLESRWHTMLHWFQVYNVVVQLLCTLCHAHRKCRYCHRTMLLQCHWLCSLCYAF